MRRAVPGRCVVFLGLTGGIAFALRTSTASAHLVTTGLGPVYDGISHLALTPEDLVPTVAIALLAGMRGARHGRLTLFVVTPAWLCGGIAGLLTGRGVTSALTGLSLLVLGGLLAADARLSLRLVVLLAALFGLFHGYVNGTAMAGAGLGLPGLSGNVAMVFVVIALVSGLVVPLRVAWSRVAVRVAGSWMAAVGLLLLAWMLRPAG